MESKVENLGALERRFDISISLEKLQDEINLRLKKLAKTTKFHGFRPGKVPLTLVKQMYGVQVQQDVINDAIHKEFTDTVKENNLKIAGYPRFENKSTNEQDVLYTVSATFEVYPEIILGDLSNQSVDQLDVRVDEVDIDKTIDMISKQRVTYKPVSRAAIKGDRVKIDYHGVINGDDFAGGKADDVQLILGDGKFLKDFESSLIGMKVGNHKSFDVVFPQEYHGKDVAGKSVTFEVKMNELEMPILPSVDEEFAKSLGVPDGDLKKLREGIKKDLEREISKRSRSKLKEQVMRAILETTQIEAPIVLINQEMERLLQDAKSDLEARG